MLYCAPMAENLFDLTGKVALVTGGSSGLGLGFARGLARAGADLMIWGRRADKNEQAAAQLRRHGGRVLTRSVDVTVEAEVIAGVAAAVQELGRIDCAIANAGIANMVPFTGMSADAWHGLLATNLHGAFYTLREVSRHMTARAAAGDAGGSLIICGSLTIMAGVAQMGHYGAAKGALNALAKSLAVELGASQVRVNVLAPGLFVTEMTRQDPATFKMINDMATAKAPLRRAGEPADLEGIVVYLASDASRYHTGDTLTIDGGQRASVW
jgi:NAD(P)-dependent dehydrogenase (short-subunit alcohol dehydrogenase family)